MQVPLQTLALRVLAVTFSASMMGGYVWFTQRKAVAKTESASRAEPWEGIVNYEDPFPSSATPATVMLSSKNISQPIFSTRESNTKEVEDGRAAELVFDPEHLQRLPVNRAPPDWVLSGSKSFNNAAATLRRQMAALTELPETRPITPEAKPSLVLNKSYHAMPGSKSGTVSLLEVPRSSPESAPPFGGQHSKRTHFQLRKGAPLLDLRDVMGNLSVTADGGGTLGFTDHERTLEVIDLRALAGTATVESYSPATPFHAFVGSKSGPVLTPPPPPSDDVIHGDSRKVVGSWRLAPSLRWNLEEAITELERQIKLGMTSGAVGGAAPPSASSTSDPTLTPAPGTPSVLSLPDASVPKPTPFFAP